MTRAEWEIMCERLKIAPDLIFQVDRHGKIIGGPWYFKSGRKVQSDVQKLLEAIQTDGLDEANSKSD